MNKLKYTAYFLNGELTYQRVREGIIIFTGKKLTISKKSKVSIYG